MAFDAFISYSQAADGEFAPALQKGLEQLARPWTQRRALRIFRDETGLSASPALWQSITEALDDAEYFVLLASPRAAQSEWVGKEIDYWVQSKPEGAARILPVITDGTFVWNAAVGGIDWETSTAAHPALADVFSEEPRFVDVVWARTSTDLDLRNTRFRDAVADLAAPMHGIPKDELEGEDVRQHRRAVRFRRAAIVSLVVLLFGASVAGLLANRALNDLEAANGNIDDLEQRRSELEGSITEAQTQLTEANAATAEAERLSAEAEAAREAAVEAQAIADTERERAENARDDATAAQSEAESDRDLALDAEQAALAQEAIAREAQERADQAAERARAAELAAELAASAAAQTDPALTALLTVESFCAIDGCTGGASESASLTDELVRVSPLLDAVAEHQDLIRVLPGVPGPVQDVAISADGNVVAALGLDGSDDWIRVWTPDEPGGVDPLVWRPFAGDGLTEAAVPVALDLSDDGSTLAVVRVGQMAEGQDHLLASIALISLTDGTATNSVVFAQPTSSVFFIEVQTVAFAPGSNSMTLLRSDDTVLVADPAFDATILEEGFPAMSVRPITGEYSSSQLEATAAAWASESTVVVGAADFLGEWQLDGIGPIDPLVLDRFFDLQGVPSALHIRNDLMTVGLSDGRVCDFSDSAAPDASDGELQAICKPVTGTAVTHAVSTTEGAAWVVVGEDNAVLRWFDWRFPSAMQVYGPSSTVASMDAPLGSDPIVVGVGSRVEIHHRNLSWPSASGWTWSAPLSRSAPFQTSAPFHLSGVGRVLFEGPRQRVSTAPVGEAEIDRTALAISADGETVIRDDQALLVQRGSVEVVPVRLPDPGLTVTGAGLSDDGIVGVALLEVSAAEQQLVVFDTATGAPLFATAVAMSPFAWDLQVTSTHVAVGRGSAARASVRIAAFEIGGAQVLTDLAVEGGWILTDAGLLVADADGELMHHPFDGADPERWLSLGAGTASLAISEDVPGLVAVGRSSGHVELWDVDSGTRLAELTRHSGMVDELLLTVVDGQVVVSSGSTSSYFGDYVNGTDQSLRRHFEVVVRTLEADVLRAALCAMGSRDLTASEWQRFVGSGEPSACSRGLG